jgi:membrane protein required for colicin V production
MEFQIIDIVFCVLMLLLALRCLLRGIIREMFSMAQWVLGFAAAFFLHRSVAAWLAEKYFPGQKYVPEILAFAGIFIAVFVIILILEKMLRDIVEGIHLGGVDSFLGAIFGLAEGLMLAALILWFLLMQPVFDATPVLQNSFFARLLSPFIGAVKNAAGAAFGASGV